MDVPGKYKLVRPLTGYDLSQECKSFRRKRTQDFKTQQRFCDFLRSAKDPLVESYDARRLREQLQKTEEDSSYPETPSEGSSAGQVSDPEDKTPPADFKVRKMPEFSDKLYGLEEVRKEVKRGIREFPGADPLTIDEYNRLIDASTPGAKPLNMALEDYPTARAFAEFLDREAVYKKAPSLKFWVTESDRGARTRRACKLGIKFCVERGIKIYFVLNGLDEGGMRQVIAKTPPGSFTNSELRYIFRNKDNPLFKENIIFFRDGKIVPAPWETDSGLWREYNPSSVPVDFIPLPPPE